MWQNIIVFAIVALAGGITLWRFYQKFTGKASCCGGGCTCKGSCGSGGSGGKDLEMKRLDTAHCGGSCCHH
jgi:hypothetical protein